MSVFLRLVAEQYLKAPRGENASNIGFAPEITAEACGEQVLAFEHLIFTNLIGLERHQAIVYRDCLPIIFPPASMGTSLDTPLRSINPIRAEKRTKSGKERIYRCDFETPRLPERRLSLRVKRSKRVRFTWRRQSTRFPQSL